MPVPRALSHPPTLTRTSTSTREHACIGRCACARSRSQALSDWILISELEPQGYYRCIYRYLRGNHRYPTSRFDWRRMLAQRCYHNSSFGPVAAWDGELILDNPRFVERSKAFSMDDTTLKVAELKLTSPVEPVERR